MYGLPDAEWSEQIIGVPELVVPDAPSGEQNEPACTPCCTPGEVGGAAVGGGCVTGDRVGGGDVAGGAVVGVVVVAGTVVVVETVVDDDAVVDVDAVVDGAMVVASGRVDVVLFEAAPAMPAIRMTSTTGTAIFAHNGHDRTQPTGVVCSRVCTTLGNCCVADAGTIGTACVGSDADAPTVGMACVAADSGGYHLPSDACHQPGSSGC